VPSRYIASQLRLREHVRQFRSERSRIASAHQRPILSMANHLAGATNVRADHGRPGGEGLEQRHGQAFPY
jgi:hypothetical protein